jgi:hypothetical protein
MSDLKRIYVVEVLLPARPPSVAFKDWVSVHQTNDQDDAIRMAKEEHKARGTNARVRQFWVEHTAPEAKPLRPGEVAPVDVPLVPYTCLDHRDRVISVHSTARPPWCPDCRTNMVPQSMAQDMDKELKP